MYVQLVRYSFQVRKNYEGKSHQDAIETMVLILDDNLNKEQSQFFLAAKCSTINHFVSK